MADKNNSIHIEDDDARAGETTGVLRWILGISLLLAIIAMSAVWIIPALMEGDVESAATAPERVEEMRDEGVPAEAIGGNPEGDEVVSPASES
jgi:hypothetical protein